MKVKWTKVKLLKFIFKVKLSLDNNLDNISESCHEVSSSGKGGGEVSSGLNAVSVPFSSDSSNSGNSSNCSRSCACSCINISLSTGCTCSINIVSTGFSRR